LPFFFVRRFESMLMMIAPGEGGNAAGARGGCVGVGSAMVVRDEALGSSP